MRLILLLLLLTCLSCKNGLHQLTILQSITVPDEPPIEDSTLDNAVIVCDGNSLTWGQVWGTPYPKQLQQTPPFNTNGSKVYNRGSSGASTSELIVRGPVGIDTLFDSSVRSILIVWEITNDIAYNGDANKAVERMKTYCQARKAAGWQVMLINTLPRNETTKLDNPKTLQNKINQANDILKVVWKDFADGYIDVTNDTRLTDPNNKQYFADGIHLTNPGMSIIKNLVVRKLKELK